MDFKWPLKGFGVLWMGLEAQVAEGTGRSSHGRTALGFLPLYVSKGLNPEAGSLE